MKKTLLLFAGASMACGVASAQVAQGQPEIFPNFEITSISPAATFATSSNGSTGVMSLINLQTGEIQQSIPEGYSENYFGGYGCNVSDNGIMVGSTTAAQDDASYYENGEWHALPIKDSDIGVCISHGITADGSRIIGQVGRASWGMDEKSVQQQPVLWQRNAENTGYDMYIELPFPEKDLLGAVPQYVTAVSISADGHRAAGQVLFGAAFITVPIVYTEGEDGTWTYEIIHPELVVDPSVELVEYPGEEPVPPEQKDFMTAEELEAYNAAMHEYQTYSSKMPAPADFMTEEEYADYIAAREAYFDDPDNNPWPQIEDYMSPEGAEAYQEAQDEYWNNYPSYPSYDEFMSEEELEAYSEAMDIYDEEWFEWYMQYMLFQESAEEAIAAAPSYLFNNVCLSANGRYLALTDSFSDWWLGISTNSPFVFDLETGEYYDMNQYDDYSSTFIGNDGSLLVCSPSDPYLVRNTFICTDLASEEFISIQEYIKGKNEEVYNWMDENMRHTYPTFAYDEDYNVVVTEHINEFCTGASVATPDFKYIASWTTNLWYVYEDFEDEDEVSEFYSYILPIEPSLGINKVASSNLEIKGFRGGMIEINGVASEVVVYDINGRKVYSNNAPSSAVATGLASGLYIVKATDAKGNVKIVKAAL